MQNQIELVLEAGTLGSIFTTIEGMILKVKDNIKQANPFALGDSAATDSKSKFRNFFQSLDKLLSGDERFTVILDDPGKTHHTSGAVSLHKRSNEIHCLREALLKIL